MTLRIGLLGASGIAPRALIVPARRRDDTEVVAVGARSADRAAGYAAEHGIARSYGGYEAVLADPEVDLVYNALPPSEHARWSLAALEAGKHVLCEKPFAMNADQARRMRAAADATGKRLIEAFHDRYHPLSHEIDAVIASGRLGELRSIESEFLVANPFDPVSIRHDPHAGGGSLMDLGCYPVHAVRAAIGEEPAVVSATAELNPLGTDMSIEATLEFPSGVTGRIASSMASAELVTFLALTGSRGTARFENVVFPSRGHSITETVDGLTRVWTVGGRETYDHELAAVVAGLASGEPLPTEGDDPVDNMVLMDAVYAAAGIDRSGW